MVKVEFQYRKTIYSNVPAPFLEIELRDPFLQRSVKLRALIDTGYDGNALIPFSAFEKLNLFRFQFAPELVSVGEFITGERIELITAKAILRFSKVNYDFMLNIDTIIGCNETLVGREFLNSIVTILNGPKQLLRLNFAEEKG